MPIRVVLIGLLFAVSSCSARFRAVESSNVDFADTDVETDSGDSTLDPDFTPEPSQQPEPPKLPELPELPETPPVMPPEECKVDPNYTSMPVSCNIALDSKNIWNFVSVWIPSSAGFSDRMARWISSYPEAKSKFGGHKELIYCPELQPNEKLIYVSHIMIPADGAYIIEILNDNMGELQLWKDGKPEGAIKVATNEQLTPLLTVLTAGHYSIVIDSIDSGVASAIILSITDGNGNMIKRSLPDDTWCIFSTTQDVDTVEYVKKAAACRFCFTGEPEMPPSGKGGP